MIMKLWRQLVSLPRHQLLTSIMILVLTTLVYSFVSQWVSDIWCGQKCRMIGPLSVVDLVFFCLLLLIVLLFTAWVRNAEQSSARNYVDENVNTLAGEIESLGEEFQRITAGHEYRLDDLRDWVIALRDSIESQSEMKLPGPQVRLRATIRAGVPTISARLTVTDPPGRMARLCLWFRRKVLWSWKWSRKWIWDMDYNDKSRDA